MLHSLMEAPSVRTWQSVLIYDSLACVYSNMIQVLKIIFQTFIDRMTHFGMFALISILLFGFRIKIRS